MSTLLIRHRPVVLLLAVLLPLLWCAIAESVGDGLTGTASALVLVLLVVAAAATGDRPAGLVAAVSGAAFFDFFLTQPVHSFAIDAADDVEVAVLLVLVGAAVTEIALWGRRQQASASARGGYLDGVMTTSQVVAGQLGTAELVDQVTASVTELLGADECRLVEGVADVSDRAVLEADGSVTLAGHPLKVERDGLPTMTETVLPARHHGAELAHLVITASTDVARPTLEQRRVAVLLANVVGADLASRSQGLASS